MSAFSKEKLQQKNIGRLLKNEIRYYMYLGDRRRGNKDGSGGNARMGVHFCPTVIKVKVMGMKGHKVKV